MDDSQDENPHGRQAEEKTTLSALRRIGRTVLPIAVTAGGLLGFVALAGGAIVWTRFSAVQVPADQVVGGATVREAVEVSAETGHRLGTVCRIAGVSRSAAFELRRREQKGGAERRPQRKRGPVGAMTGTAPI